MMLTVFLSSRISPFASTVILRVRSPRATAVVTSAMSRTWLVRLRRHAVDVVGQLLPRAADALDRGLTAEPAFRADLARDARHLGRERVQLIDHRVERRLEVEHLAPRVDGDLPRQVAGATARATSAMLRTWFVRFDGHRVDVVGQSMAANLTNQVRNIADAARAVAGGRDLSRKNVDAKGEVLDLSTLNTMVDRLNSFGSEVTRVALEVGGEGKLGAQARVQGVMGVWKDLTDSVNLMASNLTSQVRDIARVTTAVAQGDLTKTITIDVKGEILELKNT